MTSTLPNKAADLERRVADLELALERESKRARDQAALYKIAALASTADDMQAFYEGIHAILGELIYAENMYVALYDDERKLLNFAFYVDTVDTEDWPDPREWLPMDARQSRGGTGYILRTGTLHHVDLDDVGTAGVFLGELIDDPRHHPARLAVGLPQVDQDGKSLPQVGAQLVERPDVLSLDAFALEHLLDLWGRSRRW